MGVANVANAAFLSIFTAVLIAMIGVGIDKPWTGPLNATVETSLYKAFLAVCNIVFSFCMSLTQLLQTSKKEKPI